MYRFELVEGRFFTKYLSRMMEMCNWKACCYEGLSLRNIVIVDIDMLWNSICFCQVSFFLWFSGSVVGCCYCCLLCCCCAISTMAVTI